MSPRPAPKKKKIEPAPGGLLETAGVLAPVIEPAPAAPKRGRQKAEKPAPVEKEEKQREKGGTNLFTWLDSLWTKVKLEGSPPMFVINRWLASDREFAPIVRSLMHQVREPALILGVWQGILPTGRGAPKLSYPAPKKGEAAEALVVRMCSVLAERRDVVEGMLAILKLAGRERDTYFHFGIEPPK